MNGARAISTLPVPNKAPVGRTPFYRKVASELVTRIRAGEFASDGAIPTEAQLEKEFGVSRITIRLAMKELRATGLVVTQQGRGSFVWDAQDAWGHAVEVAVQADRLGFETIWLFDHLHTRLEAKDDMLFESFTSLSALAALTHHVRIGHAVACTAWRNPGDHHRDDRHDGCDLGWSDDPGRRCGMEA